MASPVNHEAIIENVRRDLATVGDTYGDVGMTDFSDRHRTALRRRMALAVPGPEAMAAGGVDGTRRVSPISTRLEVP